MRMTGAMARLIERERVCRVATAGRRGMPHLVPVCQVVAGGKIYFASGNDGRKALNLAENPRVAVTVDLYSEDWTHIKGVMVEGRARLIARGTAFRRIRARLYREYPQSAREAACHPKRGAQFDAGNPVGWYKDFLETTVMPQSRLFATLQAYGEAAVGLGLVLGLLTGLTALVGLFMCVNFALAAQWMSFGQQGF